MFQKIESISEIVEKKIEGEKKKREVFDIYKGSLGERTGILLEIFKFYHAKFMYVVISLLFLPLSISWTRICILRNEMES